jgi:hypothetical protein
MKQAALDIGSSLMNPSRGGSLVLKIGRGGSVGILNTPVE